ncbi:MAG: DUF4956 domain-containing protein [Armatimonadetes bacterium]|nr:DUF4956 domain-containing protein [Armatimonadota bacterium]
MDEWTRFLGLESGQEAPLSLWLVFLSLTVSLGCSTAIGIVYRFTHRSPGYSVGYVQTLVLTSMVTALIMAVIGSNLARAFSLVGALSVIRFRNAVKETRDVGYIFFAMAVAMAAGTRFFGVAGLATAYICAVMVIYHFLHFGVARQEPERLLRVRLPFDSDPTATLEKTFQKLFSSYSLVMAETSRQGMYLEVVYAVRCRPETGVDDVIQQISQINGNLKVSYHSNMHSEEP